jgi:hypothetical protein
MAGYIVKRGDTAFYHFKRNVPRKLVPIIGKSVWRETLGATTLAKAREAAEPLIASTSEEIRKAKAEYHRQRHALSVLTPDERAIVQEAGGFKGLRKVTTSDVKVTLPFAEEAARTLSASAQQSRVYLRAEGIDPDEL